MFLKIFRELNRIEIVKPTSWIETNLFTNKYGISLHPYFLILPHFHHFVIIKNIILVKRKEKKSLLLTNHQCSGQQAPSQKHLLWTRTKKLVLDPPVETWVKFLSSWFHTQTHLNSEGGHGQATCNYLHSVFTHDAGKTLNSVCLMTAQWQRSGIYDWRRLRFTKS